MQPDLAAAPPSGLVTLLFTRLEDASSLWRQLGEDIRPILVRLDDLLRSQMARYGGYVVKREGTDYLVAFQDPAAALRAAVAAQEAIGATPWAALAPNLMVAGGGQVVRVGMGLHTGQVIPRTDPTTGRVDYYGTPVNLAARLMQATRGNQVLLSRDTLVAAGEAGFAVDEPAREGARLALRGDRTLRGATAPVFVVEIMPLSMAQSAPRGGSSVRTLAEVGPPNNLPEAAARPVGRSAQVQGIVEAFAGGERVVFLHGPPGVGKSRVALAVAHALLQGKGERVWPGGVWWVNLAAARTPFAAAVSISQVLRVAVFERDYLAQIGRALAGRGGTVIALDEADQVVHDLPELIRRWSLAAPDVVWLVTSRIDAESPGLRVQVQPFPLPQPDTSPEGLLRDPNVRIFMARLRLGDQPTLVTDFGLLRAVVQLVVRLQGLPLALELAAAALAPLPPPEQRAQILAWSERPQTELGPTPSAATALRAVLERSWEPLEPWARAALLQLAVFRDGFAAEAAEAVLDLSRWLDAPPALDVLHTLVGNSLVQRVHETPSSEARLVLLAPVLAFALERLAEPDAVLAPDGAPASGPAVQRAAEQRHGRTFATRDGPEVLRGLRRRGSQAFVQRLSRDLENYLVATTRAMERDDGEVAAGCLRVVLALVSREGPFDLVADLIDPATPWPTMRDATAAQLHLDAGRLYLQGRRLNEAQQHISRGLQRASATALPGLRAQLLAEAAQVLLGNQQRDRAATVIQDALRLARHANTPDALAVTLDTYALILSMLGRPTAAVQGWEEALRWCIQEDDQVLEAGLLRRLGNAYLTAGQSGEAIVRHQEALRLTRELGDRRQEAQSAVRLAGVWMELGRLHDAEETLLRAIPILSGMGDQGQLAGALDILGTLMFQQGRMEEARNSFEEALVQHGAVPSVARAVTLGNLGEVWIALGQVDMAHASLVEAISHLHGFGARGPEGHFRGLLAEALAGQGKAEEARSELRSAEGLLRSTEERATLFTYLVRRGHILASLEDPACISDLREAEALAMALGFGPEARGMNDLLALRQRVARRWSVP